VRHGDGVYTFTALSADIEEEEKKVKYEGKWANNEKNGIGKQLYPGVGVYHGYWCDGKRHGEGVMQYANQDVYSGSWSNGCKEGKGTFIFFKTGEKYVGEWRKGKMVSGEWVYPNGTCFKGNFDNNKPKGAGVWSFVNGNKVEGCYKQSVKA
jgi:radial spoke head protein 1